MIGEVGLALALLICLAAAALYFANNEDDT